MENVEEAKHIAPAIGLTGALELHPEQYKPVYRYIAEVTKSDNPP